MQGKFLSLASPGGKNTEVGCLWFEVEGWLMLM